MRQYLFRVMIEEDETEDGGKAFSAWCPELPGCNTWGTTREEAVANVREAVECYVRSLLKHGDPIPVEPLAFSDTHAVSLSAPSVLMSV